MPAGSPNKQQPRQQKGAEKPGRARTRPQRAGSPSHPRTRDWITTVSLDALASEERRDASYGWGPRYREHGRFGSHPSHDSFDDESEP